MLKKIWMIWLVVFLAVPTVRGGANEEFHTLHEVLRHLEVAFVERANLGALLLGALKGLKQAAPGCEVQLTADPSLFSIKVGSQSINIPLTSISDFKRLEEALVQVGSLVIKQGLSRNQKALEYKMIREIVAHSGDPWSAVLEASLYDRLLDDGTREMGDLGMLVESSGEGFRVFDVVLDGPAHKDGIRVGMKVERVAGKPSESLNELEALALMRGEIGKKVELVVEGKIHLLVFAPEPKRNIEVDTPREGIARVRLLNFQAGTGRRLANVMNKLDQAAGGKLKGLVLDLRGNPGGLVTEGTEVVGLFINGGKVVSVVSRKQMRTEVEESRQPGPYRKLPVVILADYRSASVSEIVALALRDYGRAQIVGTKTLGKGTVQVVMELMDGSALKLSTGRYYSPKGIPLYEGIEPDVEVTWDGVGEDIQLKRARQMLEK